MDKTKLVVIACPHYDRAIIGRNFLVKKGITTRFLVKGLLGNAEFLHGDNAKDFYNL